MSAVDLDTPVWLTVTIAAIAWGTLAIVVLVIVRRGKRERANEFRGPRVHAATDRPHPAGPARTADDARGDRPSGTGPTADARAEGADPARVHRGVHGDRGRGDGRQLHLGSDPHPVGDQALLTDAELLDVARWFAIGESGPHLAHAIAKIERAAYEVTLADRASRRG